MTLFYKIVYFSTYCKDFIISSH